MFTINDLLLHSRQAETNEYRCNMKYSRNLIAGSLVLLLSAGIIAFAKHVGSQRHDQPIVEQDDMRPVEEGTFQMGNDNGYLDERPSHEVSLQAFMMDRHEVTYQEYKEFIDEHPEWEKGSVDIALADLDYLQDWDEGAYPQHKADYPIVCVSWYAAKAYAEWAGKKLPTEAQWEYAARGSFKNMDYPWGKQFKSRLLRWRGSKERGLVKVGSYTMNGFRLHDILGNAAEWTSDGYELYQAERESDPAPSINRHLKVVRGGSWRSDQEDVRVSARRASPPNACLPDVGFRCILTKKKKERR